MGKRKRCKSDNTNRRPNGVGHVVEEAPQNAEVRVSTMRIAASMRACIVRRVMRTRLRQWAGRVVLSMMDMCLARRWAREAELQQALDGARKVAVACILAHMQAGMARRVVRTRLQEQIVVQAAPHNEEIWETHNKMKLHLNQPLPQKITCSRKTSPT